MQEKLNRIRYYYCKYFGEYQIKAKGKLEMRISKNAYSEALSWLLLLTILGACCIIIELEFAKFLTYYKLMAVFLLIIIGLNVMTILQPKASIIINKSTQSIGLSEKGSVKIIEQFSYQENEKLLVETNNNRGFNDKGNYSNIYLSDKGKKQIFFLRYLKKREAIFLGQEISQFIGIEFEDNDLSF